MRLLIKINVHILLSFLLGSCLRVSCSGSCGGIPALLSLLLLLQLLLKYLLCHHLLLLSRIVVLEQIEKVEAGLAWLAKTASSGSSIGRCYILCSSCLACTLGCGSGGCLLCLGLCVRLLLCGSSCGGLRLVRANGSCVLLIVLDLLREDRELHEVVHLCLGTLNIGLINVWHPRESLVRLLLVIEGLSIVTELVVSMSDGLVAGDDLQVALSEDLQVPIEGLKEAVNGRLEVLEILVHQS